MNISRITFPLLALGVIFAGCLRHSCEPDPQADTGIEGEVRVSPIQPVVREGSNEPDYRALEGAVILIEGDAGRAQRVTSNAIGLFRINLAPGTYRLTPQPFANPYPMPGRTVEVVVQGGKMTQAVIDYDSGIR